MKQIKKYIYTLFCMLIAYTIISCGDNSSLQSNHGLAIEMWMDKNKYCLNEDIHIKVILKNIDNNGILVDKTWSLLSGYWLPEMSTGYFIVADSSGNPLPVYEKISVPPVVEGDFIVLMPQKTMEKNIVIRSILRAQPYTYGFPFKAGETYTVIAVYQNVLVTDIEINGSVINSWTGKITVSDTFEIESKGCESD